MRLKDHSGERTDVCDIVLFGCSLHWVRRLFSLGWLAGSGIRPGCRPEVRGRRPAEEARGSAKKVAEAQARIARDRARIAESRRLAALSDSVRSDRLDLAMLLALEAANEGDTPEARESLKRALEARPEAVRFLRVPEGSVTSVACGPEGRIAAGYEVSGGGGVVLFDARGQRLSAAPTVLSRRE